MLVLSIHLLKAIFEVKNDISNISVDTDNEFIVKRIFKEKDNEQQKPNQEDFLTTFVQTIYPRAKLINSQEDQSSEMFKAMKQLFISLAILLSIYLVFWFPCVMEKDDQQNHDDLTNRLFDNMFLNIVTYLLLISNDLIQCSVTESEEMIPARYLLMAFSGLSIVVRNFQMERNLCTTQTQVITLIFVLFIKFLHYIMVATFIMKRMLDDKDSQLQFLQKILNEIMTNQDSMNGLALYRTSTDDIQPNQAISSIQRQRDSEGPGQERPCQLNRAGQILTNNKNFEELLIKHENDTEGLCERLLQFQTTLASTYQNAFVNRRTLQEFIEEFKRTNQKSLDLTVELPAGFDGSEIYRQVDLQVKYLVVDPSRQLLLLKINSNKKTLPINLITKSTQTNNSTYQVREQLESHVLQQIKTSTNGFSSNTGSHERDKIGQGNVRQINDQESISMSEHIQQNSAFAFKQSQNTREQIHELIGRQQNDSLGSVLPPYATYLENLLKDKEIGSDDSLIRNQKVKSKPAVLKIHGPQQNEIEAQSQNIEADQNSVLFRPQVHNFKSLNQKPGYEPLQAQIAKNHTQSFGEFNVEAKSQSNKSSSGITDVLKNNKIFLYMVIHEMKHPTEALQSRINFVSGMTKEIINKQLMQFSSMHSSGNNSFRRNKTKPASQVKFMQQEEITQALKLLKDKFRIRNIDIDLVMDKLDYQRKNQTFFKQKLDNFGNDESEDWMISASSSQGNGLESNLLQKQIETNKVKKQKLYREQDRLISRSISPEEKKDEESLLNQDKSIAGDKEIEFYPQKSAQEIKDVKHFQIIEHDVEKQQKLQQSIEDKEREKNLVKNQQDNLVEQNQNVPKRGVEIDWDKIKSISKEPWQDNLIADEISQEPKVNSQYAHNYNDNHIKSLGKKKIQRDSLSQFLLAAQSQDHILDNPLIPRNISPNESALKNQSSSSLNHQQKVGSENSLQPIDFNLTEQTPNEESQQAKSMHVINSIRNLEMDQSNSIDFGNDKGQNKRSISQIDQNLQRSKIIFYSDPFSRIKSPHISRSLGSMQIGLGAERDTLKRQVILLLGERRNFIRRLEKSHTSILSIQQHLEDIKQTSSMMMFFLQDLLNLAHIENNKFTLNQNIFNFFEALDEAFNQVDHLAKKKNITLKSPIVPVQLTEYFSNLYGDKNRYIQILVNFLSNAIKFSPPGNDVCVILKTQELQIASESSSSSQSNNIEHNFSFRRSNNSEKILKENNEQQQIWISFQLTIRDYGCGMSQEAQNSLFLNFSRLAEHRDSNPNGVGLGLSICKDMIEQMGGDVKISSEIDKGTDFIIDLKTWCLVPKLKLQFYFNNKTLSGRLSPRDLLLGRNFQELEQIEEQASHKEKSQLYASNDSQNNLNQFQSHKILGKYRPISYESEGVNNGLASNKISQVIQMDNKFSQVIQMDNKFYMTQHENKEDRNLSSSSENRDLNSLFNKSNTPLISSLERSQYWESFESKLYQQSHEYLNSKIAQSSNSQENHQKRESEINSSGSSNEHKNKMSRDRDYLLKSWAKSHKFSSGQSNNSLQQAAREKESINILQKTENLVTNKLTSKVTRMRCLVANDMDFVLTCYVVILKQYFEHVDCAENGLAAFEAVKSHPIDFYDFIFLDINMPIMSGPQACEAISRNLRDKNLQSLVTVTDSQIRSHKRPKIIAVTADIRKEQIARLYKMNFTKVISSITAEQIEQLIGSNKKAGMLFKSSEPQPNLNSKKQAYIELQEAKEQDYYVRQNQGEDQYISKHEQRRILNSSDYIDFKNIPDQQDLDTISEESKSVCQKSSGVQQTYQSLKMSQDDEQLIMSNQSQSFDVKKNKKRRSKKDQEQLQVKQKERRS